MMISHDVIEYDVDWPKDYAYVLNGACFSREKATLELRQRLRENMPSYSMSLL